MRFFWLNTSAFYNSLIVALAIFPATASAITLKEAASLALQNNRQIEAQQMQAESAHAHAAEASAHLLPSVDARIAGARTDNPLNAFGTKLLQHRITAADFNPQLLNNPSAINNYQTEVALRMPIYQGGEIWASRRQTSAMAESADWQVENVRQQTILRLIDAFTGALEAKAMVDANEKALASARSHLHNVEAQLKRGFAIKSDVMDAEAHQLQAEVNLNQAQNALASAIDHLRLITGSDNDAELYPQGHIGLDLADHDANYWIDRALADHPALKSMHSQLDAAQANIDRSRSGFLPKLGLMASEQWNNRTPGLKNSNYTVGMEVSINLFSGGADKAKVDAAVAQSTRTELLYTDLQQQIRNDVLRAWRSLQESKSRASAQQQVLNHAEESLRIRTLREQVGLEKAADVLSAQAQRDERLARQIQSEFDVIRNQAALLYAAGALTPEVIQ